MRIPEFERSIHFRGLLIAAGILALSPVAIGATIQDLETDRSQQMIVGAGSLPTVPKPDLSAMEEAAQQKVRLAQSTLEQAVRSESLSPPELAEGFGFLGQLYHAYSLLDAAEACYVEASAALPEDQRWHYLLGIARFAKGDLAGSEASFSASLVARPGDLPTLLRLGQTMIELNRASEAESYFRQALEIEPEAAAALYGLGKALAMDGQDEQAIELFERVLELQPGASIVHYPLGQAYRRFGQRDKALEHLQQRGQVEVGFADPLGQQVSRLAKGTALEVVIDMAGDSERFSEEEFLGFALSQFGEVEGTIERLEEWLALRGDDGNEAARQQRARLHYVVGGLEVNRGRDEQALGHFRRAVELDSSLQDARIKLGNAQARGGDLEGAIRQYEEVLAADSEHVDALLKRAAARMELEQWQEAQADLERLSTLDPDRVEIKARLAAVMLRLEDPDAALALYTEALALELAPRERVQLKTRRAELLANRGSLDEAIAEFRGALDIDGEYLPGLAGLASLLSSLGRFEEAAILYAKWAELEPEAPRPFLAEATAFVLARRYREATTRLEEAILLFPGILDFKDVLARHLAACPDAAERDGDRALTLALEVFESVPSFESTETLAMAYAEAGRFAEAVDWQRRLIGEVEAEAPADVLERLRSNLGRYESGASCCGPLAQ